MIGAKIIRRTHKKLPTKLSRGPSKVKVGFPAGASDGMNISKAVWQEFGTRGGASGGGWGGPIPERPFMRNTMRNNSGKYRSALRAEAPLILRGDRTMTVTLKKLGIVAEQDVKSEITSLSSPPNSPVTIAIKGSSNPLIDTGEMRAAVTHKLDE